jgi:hypothetical protein
LKPLYIQVDDSGHPIPQDPAGKHRKSLKHGSSLPSGKFSDFTGGFLLTSCAFRQEPGGKQWKKSEKFPAGILLPQNYRNYPEPAVSGPDCSTWVRVQRKNIVSCYT